MQTRKRCVVRPLWQDNQLTCVTRNMSVYPGRSWTDIPPCAPPYTDTRHHMGQTDSTTPWLQRPECEYAPAPSLL